MHSLLLKTLWLLETGLGNAFRQHRKSDLRKSPSTIMPVKKKDICDSFVRCRRCQIIAGFVTITKQIINRITLPI